MIKKTISLILILMILLTTAIPAYAQTTDTDYSEQLAEKAIKTLLYNSYIAFNTVLSNSIQSDLIINEAGTVVENRTVKNLHITKEVGNGNITLKNVIIEGELSVECGGQNSIILENSSIHKLTAKKTEGNVRILLKGSTTVESTSVKSNVVLEQRDLTGKGFEKVSLDVNSTVQININKKVTMTSSDKNVASVDKSGTVTSNKPGVATISAVIGGKKTEICEITVIDPLARTIKILSIGNSFSQDTVFYLYDIAKSAGVNVIVGNIYSSGCSLERHWRYAMNNDKAYTYYKWSSPYMATKENQTMKDILLDEQWDYVTFQQSSGDSGIYASYQPYLSNLVKYVKDIVANPDVKLAMNMTWAYSNKSSNDNFVYYGYNQKNMYNSIINAYHQAVNDTNIDILIPCGTAIQNARTNKYLKAVGNELTSDGYHLDTGIGRYIAGLALFETIINEENLNIDIFEDVKFIPDTKTSTEDLAKLAKEAVKDAIAKPFEITSDKTKAY